MTQLPPKWLVEDLKLHCEHTLDLIAIILLYYQVLDNLLSWEMCVLQTNGVF